MLSFFTRYIYPTAPVTLYYSGSEDVLKLHLGSRIDTETVSASNPERQNPDGSATPCVAK